MKPVTAMASVTKNLSFAITTSTSYEAPYVVAKRFSTLDHLTQGRFGWNIVTSWKSSASKAVSFDTLILALFRGEKLNSHSWDSLSSSMINAMKSPTNIYEYYTSGFGSWIFDHVALS